MQNYWLNSTLFVYIIDDFMLCKSENRDPAHCLKEGRRVTRCAADLYAVWLQNTPELTRNITHYRLEKMRAACAQEFEAHWQCLELNNQASLLGATHAFN